MQQQTHTLINYLCIPKPDPQTQIPKLWLGWLRAGWANQSIVYMYIYIYIERERERGRAWHACGSSPQELCPQGTILGPQKPELLELTGCRCHVRARVEYYGAPI